MLTTDDIWTDLATPRTDPTEAKLDMFQRMYIQCMNAGEYRLACVVIDRAKAVDPNPR